MNTLPDHQYHPGDQTSVCLQQPELALELIRAAKRLLIAFDGYAEHQYGPQIRELRAAVRAAEGAKP